ncbi:MAG: DUF4339 domain-containing protein [Planctomycetales bacterium]|nr:DUF4339 domain-containing protein [Planctomycetales bacterium]
MGIRFQCPNGHALNIKSFLAGKRGICPHCGVRFRIPLESGGVAEHLEKSVKQQAAPASVATDYAHAAATSVAEPTVARPIVPMHAPANPVAPASPYVAPASSQAPPVVTDPFLEAPQASWYVRPRSGGQFGPATAEVMRRWIGEGRVSRDSLVWRDGWDDWRSATDIFPELGDPAAPSGSSTAQPISSTAARARARRSSNQLTMAMVVGMIFLAIVLLAGLIYVVSRQDFSRNDDASASIVRSETALLC